MSETVFRADLLLILARFLRTIHKEKFCMLEWYKTDENGCGTRACALGYATTIPEFQEAGLKLRTLENGEYYPLFGEHQGYTAATKLFGITTYDSLALFAPRYQDPWDRDPDLVADSIEEFVKSREGKRA